MDLRDAIKNLGVLDILNETATPIRLNQYFNEKFELIKTGKHLIKIMETLALYCVPSCDHDKALKNIINKTKDGKGHIGVVEGDFGSGKTAFMAYIWDRLENEGYMSLPPLGHADPKQIVEATGKWIKSKLESKHYNEIDQILERINDVNLEKIASAIEDTEELRTLGVIAGEILNELAKFCKKVGFSGLIILLDELEYITSVSRGSESSENIRRNLELYREFVRTINTQQNISPLVFMISVISSDWDQIESLRHFSGLTQSFRSKYNVNSQRDKDNPEKNLSSFQIWSHWKNKIAENENIGVKAIPDPFHPIIFKIIDTICFDRPGEGQQPRMRGVIRILQELLKQYVDNKEIQTIMPNSISILLKEVNIGSIKQEGILEIEEDILKIPFKERKYANIALEIAQICIPLFWNGINIDELEEIFENKDDFQIALKELKKLGFITYEGKDKIRIDREYMEKTVNRLTQDLSIRQILKEIKIKGFHEYAYPVLGMEESIKALIRNLELNIEELDSEENYVRYKITGEIEEPTINLYWIERCFEVVVSEERDFEKVLNKIYQNNSSDLKIIFLLRDFDESETFIDDKNNTLVIKIGPEVECKLEDVQVSLKEAAAIFYYMHENKIIKGQETIQSTIVRSIFQSIDIDVFQIDEKVTSFHDLIINLYRLFYPEYQPVMTKSRTPSSAISKFIEFIKQLDLEYRDFGARVPKTKFDEVLFNVVPRKSQHTTLENKFQQYNLIRKETESSGIFMVMNGLMAEKLIEQKISEDSFILDDIKAYLRDLGYRNIEIDLAIEILVKYREMYEIKKERIDISGKKVLNDVLKKRKFELDFLHNFIRNIDTLITSIFKDDKDLFNKDLIENYNNYKHNFQSLEETSNLIKDKTIKIEQQQGIFLNKFRDFGQISQNLIGQLGKFIKNIKDETGLFYNIKNIEKISVVPPKAPYPDFAGILNNIYKELQNNVQKISQNKTILISFEKISQLFRTLESFLDKLNNTRGLPEEGIENDLNNIIKKYAERPTTINANVLSIIGKDINDVINESSKIQNARNVINTFITDYYSFCEILNGKDLKSSYYDLQYSSQIIESKLKINEKVKKEMESLETILIKAKSRLNSSLTALNECVTELKTDPGLVIQFRTESGKARDLIELLELVQLNNRLHDFKDKFEKKYNETKIRFLDLISLSNRYGVNVTDTPVLIDSDKFESEFPKLDILNDKYISIILRSKSLETQLFKLSQELIELLLSHLSISIKEVDSNYEIFKKIIDISSLRGEDQESIQKSITSIEEIEKERIQLLNSLSNIEEPNKKINSLYVRIKKQQEFIKELWQIYQSRLEKKNELLNVKNDLMKIQSENKGPFSLYQYILNFKNLERMSRDEIHELLLNSAENIFQLALEGHLKLKFEVIKSEDEE